MNKFKVIIVVFISLLLESYAFADQQQHFYIEPMYSYQNVNFAGSSYGVSALGVNLGYQFNESLAAEIRLGTGIKDSGSKNTEFNSNQKMSNKLYGGAYLRLKYPVANKISFYGLLGLALNVQERIFNDAIGSNSSVSNTSFGLGGGFGLTMDYSKSVSYTLGLHYIKGFSTWENGPVSYQLGLQYKF